MADKRKMIHLCLPHMCGKELEYIREALDSNWVAPLGGNVDGFEEDLRRFLEEAGHDMEAGHDTEVCRKEVVALSSGTAAIHLALLSCGVGPGDEVLCQSLTFCATANPIKYLGATPVFVDSEPDTWNMDPDLLEEAIRDRIEKTGKTPKAIIPVALFGMPFRIDKILEVAERYGIPVIEDAAEALGSTYKGRPIGTFGRYGIFSFNGNKVITTSGGGALVCGSPEDKERIKWFASQARDAYPYYHHEAVGYNYRLSNVSAGIGRGQMHILQEHIEHHRGLKALYKELLAEVPGIETHDNPSDEYDSNFWLIAITLDPDLRIKGQENSYKTIPEVNPGTTQVTLRPVSDARSGCEPGDNVEALRLALDKAGIETRPIMKPMHRQPVYKDAPAYLNGVSDSLFMTGLCLPSGPHTSVEDVRYIVRKIKEGIVSQQRSDLRHIEIPYKVVDAIKIM